MELRNLTVFLLYLHRVLELKFFFSCNSVLDYKAMKNIIPRWLEFSNSRKRIVCQYLMFYYHTWSIKKKTKQTKTKPQKENPKNKSYPPKKSTPKPFLTIWNRFFNKNITFAFFGRAVFFSLASRCKFNSLMTFDPKHINKIGVLLSPFPISNGFISILH